MVPNVSNLSSEAIRISEGLGRLLLQSQRVLGYVRRCFSDSNVELNSFLIFEGESYGGLISVVGE
jgi:hypothetical protein